MTLHPLDAAPRTFETAEQYLQRRLGHPLDILTRFPKYLNIETINTCNARCVMCGIDFDSRTRQLLPDNLFAKVLDEMADHADQIERVGLWMDCEPLMDRRL